MTVSLNTMLQCYSTVSLSTMLVHQQGFFSPSFQCYDIHTTSHITVSQYVREVVPQYSVTTPLYLFPRHSVRTLARFYSTSLFHDAGRMLHHSTVLQRLQHAAPQCCATTPAACCTTVLCYNACSMLHHSAVLQRLQHARLFPSLHLCPRLTVRLQRHLKCRTTGMASGSTDRYQYQRYVWCQPGLHYSCSGSAHTPSAVDTYTPAFHYFARRRCFLRSLATGHDSLKAGCARGSLQATTRQTKPPLL